jgi:hypothetical protein
MPTLPAAFLPERASRAQRGAARTAAVPRKAAAGMLPLYALVAAAALVLASHWAPVLGAWPLLTVLACPLLHLGLRRD